MVLPHRGRWPEFDAVETEAPSSGRPVALLRAVFTPANLVVMGTLAFGWLAPIGWTGAGPDSWQARVCADLDLQPRACAMVQSSGTAS